MTMAYGAVSGSASSAPDVSPRVTFTFRAFAWWTVATTFVFLVNNYLTFWLDWPGVLPWLDQTEILGPTTLRKPLDGTAMVLGAIQFASYLACIAGAVLFALRTPDRTLRQDSSVMTDISAYMIRAAFWSVLFIGIVDFVVSFLKVEDLLVVVFGEQLATDLGRSRFRGPYVHMPLVGISLVIAAFNRSLGFHWLALMVVAAELTIVLSRFIFSYEQAFQGDVVRFWYAALFLFASAYTLLEDGHVRVDVLYTGFSRRRKGYVNAIGSVILGLSLCWVILALGMWSNASIINSPLLSWEVTQSSFGLYVKYLMAGFLALFAISMSIQFSGYLLESVADIRGEPGAREPSEPSAH